MSVSLVSVLAPAVEVDLISTNSARIILTIFTSKQHQPCREQFTSTCPAGMPKEETFPGTMPLA